MKTFVLQRKSQSPAPLPQNLAQALNPQQIAAVSHQKGPALVIAGAGTGKTRVLTYRVAHLIASGVAPESILLLTFTRRAANQMLSRAATLTGQNSRHVRGGTFHAFANGVLRQYAKNMGLDPNFTVLDESDAAETLDMLRAQTVKRGRRFPRKQTIKAVYSHMINRGLDLERAVRERCPQFLENLPDLEALYHAWQDHKLKHNLVDFDDLLLYLYGLLRDHPEVGQALTRQYQHILVDEYQDTNLLQGQIVQLLAAERGNIMVVGDEAQSIYAFRGATVRNILDFPTLFENAKTYPLEQNYRSSPQILSLANTLMEGATETFGKRLFTDREAGDLPFLVACPSVQSQGQFIAQQILELRDQGIPLDEQAVLFRSARHSAELEIELTRLGIPYRKFGGVRFMDAAHIKDVLTHLRVHHNIKDTVSWHRILKLVPGVGAKTANALATAMTQKQSPTQLGEEKVPTRAHRGILALINLFKSLAESPLPPAAQIQLVAAYYQPLLENKYDDHPKRKRDIDHLLTLADPYLTVEEMLADMALDPPGAKQDIEATDDDEVLTLSTVHSAKGLEWNVVFLLYAADGYFPSGFSLDDEAALEEERRLMYVAITRARNHLLITYPEVVATRQMGLTGVTPSRFLYSIDENILEPARLVEAG